MKQLISIIIGVFAAMVLFKFLKSIGRTLLSATVIGIAIYVIMSMM